ncbi:hypothetical protein [Flavobacterium sp. LAR06]|uniref:hypothetical protein n=1 Tax=Flavobacterium sp. LAR06 TaxID=3064897 RepID=UPI0035C0E266
MQYIDGNRKGLYALLISDPQDPNQNILQYPISATGLNVRAKEFDRLFTTTTILESLADYEQKYGTNTF